MSSVIGALRANLSMNSAEFTSGVNRARSSLTSLRNQFAVVAGAAAALGAAISAAAMRGSASIDRMAKDARRLDSTVIGLRSIELAAGEAGVPVAALTNTIQTMNRELARETPAATEALKRLGLSVNDLRGLDADEKLARIADAVKNAGLSAGETTALLSDLGVRSREMVLAMLQGGDAFRNARQDVLDYGLAISSIDSDRIEEANDRIGRLSIVTEYLQNQLAIRLVPAFGELAYAITESMRAGGTLRVVLDGLLDNLGRISTYIAVAVTGFGVRYVAALVAARLATMSLSSALAFLRGALIRTGIGALIVGAGELVYQFTRLTQATGSVSEAFSMMLELGKSVVNELVEVFFHLANQIVGVFRGAFGAVSEIFWALPDVFRAIAETAANGFLGAIENMINGAVRMINTFVSGVNEAIAKLPSWAGGGAQIGTVGEVDLPRVGTTNTDRTAEAGRRAARAFVEGFNQETFETPQVFETGGIVENWRNITTTISDAAGSAAEPVRELTSDIGDLNEELEKTGGSGGGSAKAGLQDAKEGVQELSEEAQAAISAVSRLRDGMASAFANVVTGAQSARQAVGNLLRQLAQLIANNAFQQLFTGAFGTGVTAGGGTSFLGGIASALFGGIPGFANGTNNAPGGLAWVGERGPELVNLPRGSQVFNAERSKQLAGGGSLDIRLHVPEGVTAEQVEGIATGVTVRVVSQTATAQRRALGGSLNEANRRGT